MSLSPPLLHSKISGYPRIPAPNGANDIWQSDVLHGPTVEVDGRKRKTYPIAFIDDHSRLIPYWAFYLSESIGSFLTVLEQAFLTRGLSRKLYVDNGAAFFCVITDTTVTPIRQAQDRSRGENARRKVWMTPAPAFRCIIRCIISLDKQKPPPYTSAHRNQYLIKIVAKYTIGVDDVDVEAATDLGILVTHSPTESNWGGVAAGTITMMLTLLKKTRERDRYIKKNGKWRDKIRLRRKKNGLQENK